MHFPTLLLAIATALAAKVTSTPITIANQTPLALTDNKWTLEGLTRQRSNDSATCRWRFKVTDTTPSSLDSTLSSDSSTATTANLPRVRCSFKTSTKLGFDCGLEDFDPVKCSKSSPSYFVAGGHERFGGFFMLVVSNADAGLRAYFMFDEALLEAGEAFPPQTARVQNDMVPPLMSPFEDGD
ncbi:hypothetical protein F5X97DRAFT_299305 [Nemania serpens]|nr:hypothetical protein F5X97DRAFT_299305 [Nemania serpens]